MVHIKVLAYSTGLTLKSLLRRVDDNKIYSTDTEDFVTEAVADIDDYILTPAEDDIGKQTYNLILDKDLRAGRYILETYIQSGVSLDPETDTRLSVGTFQYQNVGVYAGYIIYPDPQVSTQSAMAGSSIYTIENVEIAAVDTEYSLSVSNAQSVKMNFQNGTIGSNWRFAFVEDKVATPVHNYMLYDQGVQEELVNFNGTIYFAASTTGYMQFLIRG